MKKTYKAPKYKTIDLTGEAMIAGSQTGGVATASSLIDDYTEKDVSYVKSHSAWDDEW